MNCIAFTGFSRYSEAFPQTVLLGRFVELSSEALFRAGHHAERPENTASGICRTPSHSLRGHGAVAAFLQQAPIASAASALPQGVATACRLSSLRSDPGAAVRHHGRPAAHQQNRDSAVFPCSALVHGFKRLCLPRSYLFATLDTIRTDFLVLPAKLVKRGSQNPLVLPQGYHHEAEFRAALKTIDKIIKGTVKEEAK